MDISFMYEADGLPEPRDFSHREQSADEGSARSRILAIWGDFNEITNDKKFNEKCEWYKKHLINNNRIKFSGEYYVLDTSCIINLSKEETLEHLKFVKEYPHEEGRLKTDEIKEACDKWKKEKGYENKIIIFNKEAFE